MTFTSFMLPEMGCRSKGDDPQASDNTGMPGSFPFGKKRPENVVILLVDTLRADGLEKSRTPVLTDLAAHSMDVDRAWAPGTWTVPSVTSLFCGAFARTTRWDFPVGTQETTPLPSLPMLPEILQENGFTTHGLYNNSYLTKEIGFGRGFEMWRHTSDELMPQEVAKVVQTWKEDDAEEKKNHFLYIHLIGPHSGLNPSAEARARWNVPDSWFEPRFGLLIGRAKRGTEPGVRDAYKSAYYAVVEDVDARVGEILKVLEPYRSETLLVFMADHGEELGETGVFEHGWSVAESLTHVPLLLSGPGVKTGHRAWATTAEVADYVTDALDIRFDWPVQSPWKGPIASERHGKMAVLADGRWKGVWSGNTLKVYDLQADPTGLTTTEEGRDAVLDARKAWTGKVPEGPALDAKVALDPKTVEAVRALGYME